MSSSDVQTKRVTATGSLAVGPARVRQLQVLTITNGNGGATLIDLDFLQNDSHSVNIPDNGVRFESDVWISVETNITAVTVFYS